MTGRLAGKRIAILGAGQTRGDTEGNGRAMARIFSHEGADLLLVARDEAAACATADICAGPNAVMVSDVAEEGPRPRRSDGHMGQAEDVAFAALYLMTDEAKFLTGVILPVDGRSSVKVAI